MSGIKLVQDGVVLADGSSAHPAPISVQAGILCYLSFVGSPTPDTYAWALIAPAEDPGAVISSASSPGPTFLPELDNAPYSVVLNDGLGNLYYVDVFTPSAPSDPGTSGITTYVTTAVGLRGYDPGAATSATVVLRCRSVIGDGGGGTFTWNPTNDNVLYPDDGGTRYVPTTRVGGVGCWDRQITGRVNARWFGARGDAQQIALSLTAGATTFSVIALAVQPQAGQSITINGAGVAGATYAGAIVSNNGVTATISPATSTTVVAATPVGRAFYGTDDTAALNNFVAYMATKACRGFIPSGNYFTDGITYTTAATGTTIEGDGTRQQFGGSGTRLLLRRAGTHLFSQIGYSQIYESLIFDGNFLATTAVFRHRLPGSNNRFGHCYVTGIAPGQVGILFEDVGLIDKTVWDHPVIAGHIDSFAYTGGTGVKITNQEAFCNQFENPTVYGLDVGFRFRKGSCHVRDAEFGPGMGTRKIQIDGWCQSCELSATYSEGSNVPFVEAVWDSTLLATEIRTSDNVIIIRGSTIRDVGSIITIGAQPFDVENAVIGGGIIYNPAADITHTGTIDVTMIAGYGNSTIVGHGTAFTTELCQFGSVLLINQEEILLLDTPSNTSAHLTRPGTSNVAGVALVERFAIHRLTARNINFVGGAWFSGAGLTTNKISWENCTRFFTQRSSQNSRESFAFTELATGTASQTVTVEDGVSWHLGTASVNVTVEVRPFNVSDGSARMSFSRFFAADAKTLTVTSNGTTLGVLVIGQWLEIETSGTGGWQVRNGGSWPDVLTTGKMATGTRTVSSAFQAYVLGTLGLDYAQVAGAAAGASLEMYSNANAAGALFNTDGSVHVRDGGSGHLRVEQTTDATNAGDLVYSAEITKTAGTALTTIDVFRAGPKHFYVYSAGALMFAVDANGFAFGGALAPTAPQAWSAPTNHTDRRTLDETATTLVQLANNLGTLINDLRAKGILA